MKVTDRNPKRFQEMLIPVLLPALLGLLPSLALAAEPPGPTPARNQPLSEALRRQVAQFQLQADLKELVQLRSDLRKATVELEILQTERKQPTDTVSDEAIELAIDQNLAVKDYLAAVKKKQEDLTQLERTIAGGRNSSIYKDEQARLQALERELAARRRKVRPLVEEELKQKSLVEVATRIKSCQERIAIAKELEKKVLADIQQLSGEKAVPPAADEERLRVLEREVWGLKQALQTLEKNAAKKD